MLNSNIPLMGRQPDFLGEAQRGLQFGQGMRQLLALRQAGKMNQIEADNEADTYAQRKAFANNSMFGRELNAALKADQAAKAQALMAQQKHEADTAKTWSDAGKIGVEAQGLGLKNSGALLENANRALTVAAQTGDPMAAKLALNNAYKAGTITPELYEQYTKQIDILGTDPEALKQFAQSITIASAEKPEQYIQPDANTVLDNQTAVDNNIRTNQTSENNNVRTTQASMYSTDVNADTADKNRQQNQQQFEANFEYKAQQDEIKNGEAKIQEFGGKSWVVYKNGEYKPAIGTDGKQIAGGKAETKIQAMERQEKVINLADAARSASEATGLAAKLANDLDGLNKAAGGFGIWAKIPASDAKRFANDLETLKSNVFLSQVELMKGMGALTDAEGERLEKAIASLDLSLDPPDLQKNLTYIAQTLSRVAKSTSKKAQLYAGVNTTGTAGPTQEQSNENVDQLQSILFGQ